MPARSPGTRGGEALCRGPAVRGPGAPDSGAITPASGLTGGSTPYDRAGPRAAGAVGRARA